MPPTSTAQQLISYYEALLIAEYQKPKAIATIGALAGGNDGEHGIIANAIYTQVRSAFDLGGLNGNTPAVGQQLDFLGELIGPTRFLNGLSVSLTYGMQMPTYAQIVTGTWYGFTTYADPWPPPTSWLTYQDFAQNTLTDGQYRSLLQFQAKVNGLLLSYGEVDQLMLNFCGDFVNLLVTPQTWTYQHLTSDPGNLFEILNQLNLLPAPAGVTIAVQEVSSF
jgi:hypothetical protein